MKEYKVIGLMSGTSLDGVDLACCRFVFSDGKWRYEIAQTATYAYPSEWNERLTGVYNGTALDLARTHTEYGKYLGGLVQRFKKEFEIDGVDFISSHGHTLFHQPSSGFTTQIGEGAALAAACGDTVVCDFRTGDVAYGGQGAPLVPIGDQHLFPEYTFCLNLGGIANISYAKETSRIAFDICPCNILFNEQANLAGQPFDKDGMLAAAGSVDEHLLKQLNALDYYQQPMPKSLGREDMEKHFAPLIRKSGLSPSDNLRTLVEHAALQIAATVAGPGFEKSSMLLSGGGTFNKFLVQQIRHHAASRLEIPGAVIVNYKEALIFAFLGVLRMRGEPTSLRSVTGARKDVIGGCVYLS